MKNIYLFTAALLIAIFSANNAKANGNWADLLSGSYTTVVLDPGHGGDDPGAAGYYGLHEGELCLRCAGQIYNKIVTELGGTCVMTRWENDFEGEIDLSPRRDFALTYDPYIFCSIHLNAFNQVANGTETWYYFDYGGSAELASYVQNQLITQFYNYGGYSSQNRGVKQNGWTVITGTSSVPSILTESLFVDNYTEWSLIADNSYGGFQGWVMGHLMGFYNYLAAYWNGNITAPDQTSGPVTQDPTIEVSPLAVAFSDVDKNNPGTQTYEITVKASNLTEDISYNVSNWNNFTVGQKYGADWNPRTGGTLVVTFVAKEPGMKKETLKITSSGVTKNISLTGKVTSDYIKLTEGKNLSDKLGNSTAYGYDSKEMRNFTFSKGKIYAVYQHNDIKALNARTLEDLGNLNKDIISGGTLPLCDVKVCDGHIVACNLATAASGETLKLYTWDADDQPARLLAEITDLGGAARIGDCMSFGGTWENGRLLFANDDNTTTRIIEYAITNGVVNTTPKVTIVTTDGTTQLATRASTRVRPSNTGYWIDGKSTYLSHINTSGVREYYFDTDVIWGNDIAIFSFGGITYALTNTYNVPTEDATKNYTGGRMRLLDVSDNNGEAITVADYPTDGLSDNLQNTNCTGGVLVSSKDGEYVEAWILSTKQGIAYYKYVADGKSLPDYDVTPITPAGPTIRANKESISFSGQAYSKQTETVNIYGSYLEGDIDLELSGDGANMFSIDKEVITKSEVSATVTVTYYPTEAGTHTATITATSPNADPVMIELTGTATPKTEFSDVIDFTEVWNYSGNGNSASWLDLTTSKIRSTAFLNGNLYVLHMSYNQTPKIVILDAYTGVYKGELSVNGFGSSFFPISNIIAFDGKLYGSGIATEEQTLYVYRWDSDTSNPTTVLATTDHNSMITGAQMSASGNASNGYFWFSGHSSDKVLKYAITDGVVSTTPTIISLTYDGYSFVVGDGRGSACIRPRNDGSFWLDGKDYRPSFFDATGTGVMTMNPAALDNNPYGTAFDIFTFGSKKYMAAVTYKNDTKNGGFVLIDITNDVEGVTTNLGFYPTSGLGNASNAQRISNICVEKQNNDKTVNIWVSCSEQGVAYYTYNGETLSAVNTLTTDANATIVAIYSVDGRFRTELQQGINIVKMSDGTTRKIIVANKH